MQPAQPMPTVEVLAGHLKTLANSSRLELLGLLRTPRTVDEIVLAPPGAALVAPSATISRQAVQRHLDLLVRAGLLRREPARRGSARSSFEYVLDHTQVFALLEELRTLTAFQSSLDVDLLATRVAPAPPAPRWPEGPKLVLVHGVREGYAFPLEPRPEAAPRGWVIGRAKHADVALVYDPFVSAENAEILQGPDGYRILDLRSARNGTSLNWERLPPGGEAPLEPGDVIGVGRTRLVFRPR